MVCVSLSVNVGGWLNPEPVRHLSSHLLGLELISAFSSSCKSTISHRDTSSV